MGERTRANKRPRSSGSFVERPTAVVQTHDRELLCVESPGGRTTISFVGRNDLGVSDHDVTLPSGEKINNPFRVLARPEAAEVLFTLRQLGLSDTEFDRDAGLVEADLRRLKELVES
jgi:hypothetical protein